MAHHDCYLASTDEFILLTERAFGLGWPAAGTRGGDERRGTAKDDRLKTFKSIYTLWALLLHGQEFMEESVCVRARVSMHARLL